MAAVGGRPFDDHLAAEMLEERPGHAAAGAVAAVEPDPRPVATDGLDIDRGGDELHVGRRAIHLAKGP